MRGLHGPTLLITLFGEPGGHADRMASPGYEIGGVPDGRLSALALEGFVAWISDCITGFTS
jgi:hypothetical protein